LKISDLPALNALLNGTSAILLLLGHSLIKRKLITAHRRVMIAAFAVSSFFLASYLIYHAHVGSVRFLGTGWVRPVYFTILISHTILAATVVPLVLITLARGLRGNFERHRAIARWTYPIWLYVSVTGVVVYLMLYRLYPHT
jgi:putative membrane protein